MFVIMEPIDFKQAVSNSPVLDDAAKTWLIEHEAELGDTRRVVLDALLQYEKDILAGAEDLTDYLGHSST